MNEQREHIFFTDRDLGKQFPCILRKSGISIERHIDHFVDTAKDEEWLTVVGRYGWFVLTHDRKMRYERTAIEAVKKFMLGVFVVVGKAPMAELAQNCAMTFAKIQKFIEKNPRPFIAKIYRPSKSKKKTQDLTPGYVKMWISY